MKKKVVLIILLLSWILPRLSKAQCTITKEIQDDGGIFYTGTNQTIYANNDLENGIQIVVLQIKVIQKERKSDLLKFVFKVTEVADGKPEISPRVLIFTLVNGTVLQFKADGENLSSSHTEKTGHTAKMNIDFFQFKMSDYLTFQQTDIASIKIIDDGKNMFLLNNCNRDAICNSDVILKQANCIAEAIN